MTMYLGRYYIVHTYIHLQKRPALREDYTAYVHNTIVIVTYLLSYDIIQGHSVLVMKDQSKVAATSVTNPPGLLT
jgi:hypothetical protein